MGNIKKFKFFTEGLETEKSWEYSQTVVDEKVKEILLKLIDELEDSYGPDKPNRSIIEKIDLVKKFIKGTNFQNLENEKLKDVRFKYITLGRLLTKYLDSISKAFHRVLHAINELSQLVI